MSNARHLGYRDELLADGQVHRRYEDGRSEWRRRGTDRQIHWHDSLGRSGTDEPLGRDLVKRRYADGTAEYGRDLGYGRTVWGSGRLVTLNRSSFGGRLGVVVGALGVAGVAAITAAQLPPMVLSEAEEEELRQQARQQTSSSGGGDGGGGSGGSGDISVDGDGSGDQHGDPGTTEDFGDWGDSDDGWDGDDFG